MMISVDQKLKLSHPTDDSSSLFAHEAGNKCNIVKPSKNSTVNQMMLC